MSLLSRNLALDTMAIFLEEKVTKRFVVGVILGLGFSMSVILCAIGIMDGFDAELQSKLRTGIGDITLTSREGLISKDQFEQELNQVIKTNPTFEAVSVYIGIQTEAYVLKDKNGRGVLLQSGYDFGGNREQIKKGTVLVGKDLAKFLNVDVGDELVLTLRPGQEGSEISLPKLVSVKIAGFITQGLFEMDSRLIRASESDLEDWQGQYGSVNWATLSWPHEDLEKDRVRIDAAYQQLKEKMPESYQVHPFWQEFAVLFEAVKIEKNVLALSLQIIVLVSLFNVLGLIVFLHDRKLQEIFLMRALGLSGRKFKIIWFQFLFLIWVVSCLLSLVFVAVFDVLLKNLAIFNLPGEIYHLSQLKIILHPNDYAIVFIPALVQILVLAYLGLRKIMKKSVLSGLRFEFS